MYLYSNLAFCSFFLFQLLYSVLVTHHSAGSDQYSSINSIKNCRFFGSPFGRHSVVNSTTNNNSWHNHTLSTPSNTEVCLCKHALRRRKHWLLAQKIPNCFDFTQAACASTQTIPYTVKMFVQTLCLRKLLARVGAALKTPEKQQRKIMLCIKLIVKTAVVVIYIGETSKKVGDRLKEHKRNITTAYEQSQIFQHIRDSGHTFNFKEVQSNTTIQKCAYTAAIGGFLR